MFAGIGENFEKGGIAFGGDLSFQYSPASINEDWFKSYIIALNIRPDFHFFIIDNISFALYPNLGFSHGTYDDYLSSTRMGYGLYSGFSYYYVPDPEAEKGFVMSLGFNIGIDFDQGLTRKANGERLENKSLFILFDFVPSVNFYYFLTERVALRIGINPSLFIMLYARGENGDVWDTPLEERMDFHLFIRFGFSWHRPPKSVALIPVD